MNLFTQPVTLAYDRSDATLEILVMLVVAGLIGYAIHYLVCALRGCCHGAACERGASVAMPAIAAQPTTLTVAPVHAPVVVHPHDDLEIIEGIGPKVRQVLNDAQIFSFAQVAALTPAALRAILDKAGEKFRVLKPDTWPHQAELARDGKIKELKEYQDFLVGGIEPGSK